MTFDDRGQIAGMEAIVFGFLLLVIGSLVLANAWAVVDAKYAATAAAREAIRAYVEAPDGETALIDADLAARSSIAAHGRDPSELRLTIDARGEFGRCQVTTAEVALEVESVHVPFIGGFGRLFDIRATHSEVIDPYRSGLEGRAVCDG
jgi:hypothetical protein